MGELRDYQEWHQHYDDPDSGLSWRLRTVQQQIRSVLDASTGPLRVLSLCSGDGRDLADVVAERSDGDRIRATLVELHPGIAEQARQRTAAAGLPAEVLTADAALTDTYLDAVPADLVLLVGIFGNISDDDVRRTIAAAPQLCAPGATLLWSRGRHRRDINADIRDWFRAAGFSELGYATHDSTSQPALGVLRYDGVPQPLVPARLFTFLR